MIVAWIIMAALLLASVYFVVSHLTQKHNQGQYMAQFVRLREEEIAHELEVGRLDQEEAEQLKADLVEEAKHDQKSHLAPLKSGVHVARNALVIAFGITFLGAVSVYYQLGYTKEIVFTEKLATNTASNEDISGFLTYRSERYGRAEDWYYVAKDDMAKGDYAKAVSAYEKSLEALDPESEDRIEIQVEFAQAIFYANNNQVSDKMIQVVDSILRSRPEQPVALGLKGVALFDQGDFRGALITWQNAVIHGKNPNERAALVAGINKAREMGGITEKDVPPLISHRVQIKVDLVSGQLDPHSVYLVYAVGQTPMPVAIKRLTAEDMLKPIELTNLDNLMPGASLAQLEEVKIVVKQSPANANDLTQGNVIGELVGVPTQGQQIFHVSVSM